MEGMMGMEIQEALLAPPLRPIAIDASERCFDIPARSASKVVWSGFKVKKMTQIHLLVA